jgi:alpha-galactosidase
MKKLIPVIFLLLTSFSCSNNKKVAGTDSMNETGIKSGPDFKSWAQKPPMGWNSYNCYGAAVTEKEVRANSEYMAGKLKELGWEYIVVDYCWSYPHPPGSIQNNPPQFRMKLDGSYVPWLAMDQFGRLLPDTRKFPSSYPENGFKPLADYVHSMGLKFGIHIMRGIPRQAVWAKSPVKGTSGIDASMIADTSSTCPWLNQMFGVNMKAAGAQEYYNSLAGLYASWGVDYIKMDDMYQNETGLFFADEAEAMHKAILKCGRPIVLSLSPFMNYEYKDKIKNVANLWRISNDFWDNWESLKAQFELAYQWNDSREPGNWPDADMLQLGIISRRGPSGPERQSRFSEDEQMTHMFFWCIIKSPLMMGGDMPANPEFVELLLTNPELIAVDQDSENPVRIFSDGGTVAWSSDIPDSKGKYVAVFNLNDEPADITVTFHDAGMPSTCRVRDIWNRADIGTFTGSFTKNVNPHGSMVFMLTRSD